MTGTSITKVAIVTGAARGIGEAIAVRLASDGYAVAVSDLSSAKAGMENVVAQIVKAGGKAVAIACDVRSKDEVDALVAATVQQLGRLDCMVANAGIAPVGAFMDLKEDVLNSLLDVNVKGVLWCYQAAARAMIEQGEGGKLIAACSTAGFQGAPGFAGYCMSKWAVRSMNQNAAAELAQHGIVCNVYCPSPIATDMWTAIDRDLGKAAGAEQGAVTAKFLEGTPMGRLGTAKDISNVVSFLASSDCSYMSGESIIISGGQTMR